MALIKLDAAELKNQAAEMSALSSEYERLFSDVSDTLYQMNENWSANLANNFSSKIISAQKSFSSVIEMLMFGANAAESSSASFESIDMSLAKAMNKKGDRTDAAEKGAGGSSFGGADAADTKKSSWEEQQLLTETLKNNYDKLPKWAQKLIDKVMDSAGTKDEWGALQLLILIMAEDSEAWLSLDIDPEIISSFLSVIGVEKVYAEAASTIYDMVINPSGDFGFFMNASDDFLERCSRAFVDGDYVEGLKNLGLSLGIGLYGLGYGVFEGLTETGANLLEGVGDLYLSLKRLEASVTPGTKGEVLDFSCDLIEKGVDSVTGWIRGLF